jgi:ubiquinol-cytochrome c reductase iron-sulfur subunit
MMRKFLVAATWLMFGVIVAATTYVFIDSFGVHDSVENENIRIVNITNLKPGEILKVKMKYPVWIFHRSKQMSESMGERSMLADPDSTQSIQPKNARNQFRSLKSKYFVFVPMFDWTNKYSGWHGYLGVKEGNYPFNNDEMWWFVDSVGAGLRFDISGRVAKYEGFDWLQEVNNVVVPKYEYLSNGSVKIDLSNLHLSSDPFR